MTSILLLDESLPRLESLSRVLEAQGYELVLTVEPSRAIRLCQEVCFDAVLCNLHLSDGSETTDTGEKTESETLFAGIDAISKLTTMEPHQKVIVISSDLPTHASESLANLGAFGIITQQKDDPITVAEGVMQLVPHVKSSSSTVDAG